MRNEALQDGIKTSILRMLNAEKYTLEEISDITGLSFEDIITLKEEINT